MPARKVERSLEAAKRMERHLEEIADKVLTKDTMNHFMKAGSEFVQGMNAAVKKMEIPTETKDRIHSAEREVLLAWKSFIDAVLVEVEKEIKAPPKKAELKKIDVKRKSK